MRQAIQGCYDCVHRAFFVFVILHDEWFPLMLLLLKYILCSNKSKELGEFFCLVSEQGERILIQACWASMKFTGRGSLYSKKNLLHQSKALRLKNFFNFDSWSEDIWNPLSLQITFYLLSPQFAYQLPKLRWSFTVMVKQTKYWHIRKNGKIPTN